MSIKAILLLAAATPALSQNNLGPGEYPFSKSFPLEAPVLNLDPFAPPPPPPKHDPVCATEESFFKKDLSFRRQGNKASFLFKGATKEFVGLDSPFSHEANAQSMLMIEEEEIREGEKRGLALRGRGAPQVKLLVEKAEVELGRSEEQLQEMAKQARQDPNLALDAGFSDLRKRLLQQQGALQNKVMLLKDQALAEEQEIDVAVKEDLEKVKFDLWYINMNKSDTRKECIERQLQEAGIENFNRFPAVEIRGMTPEDQHKLRSMKNPQQAEKFYLEQLNALGYGDCVEAGVDMFGTGTHGSHKSNEWHVRSAVVANYCGHKRLLKEQEKNASAADYIVVMEDDVIIDRNWFKLVIEDFIKNFDKKHKWSMVQLDPFGYKSMEDFVGHFRGKPVWKPQYKPPCSQYWGFHAIIFRKSALKDINELLSNTPAMPIDWLQYKVDNALAFSSLIARNPESLSNGNWAGPKQVVLPAFCAKNVMKSTIA